jgi:hypothetical protein
MMEKDLTNMTKAELRSYVIAHPGDRSAFDVFVDRFTADAPSETFSMPSSTTELEEIDRLIQQKVRQSKLNH